MAKVNLNLVKPIKNLVLPKAAKKGELPKSIAQNKFIPLGFAAGAAAATKCSICGYIDPCGITP